MTVAATELAPFPINVVVSAEPSPMLRQQGYRSNFFECAGYGREHLSKLHKL